MIRDLQDLYRARCHEAGNINEHLPLLYMLSVESEGVAEFGIDRGISTSALMAGQETRSRMGGEAAYYGFDPNKECTREIARLAELRSHLFATTFTESSSLQAPQIAPVDLLLIDSLHTEETIREELSRHLPSVRKYVALHDTVTFGENGETPGTRGILYGIGALLNPGWLKVYDSPRNNGMAVFKRVDNTTANR